MFGGVFAVLDAFGTGDHNFACSKNQSRSFRRLFFSHDHSRKTFGVVLSVEALLYDVVEIELAVKRGCGHKVNDFWLAK